MTVVVSNYHRSCGQNRGDMVPLNYKIVIAIFFNVISS